MVITLLFPRSSHHSSKGNCAYKITLFVLIHFSKAIDRFTQLADDSDEVPNLKKKEYRHYRLNKDEWTQLELMREVLQVCPLFLFAQYHVQ